MMMIMSFIAVQNSIIVPMYLFIYCQQKRHNVDYIGYKNKSFTRSYPRTQDIPTDRLTFVRKQIAVRIDVQECLELIILNERPSGLLFFLFKLYYQASMAHGEIPYGNCKQPMPSTTSSFEPFSQLCWDRLPVYAAYNTIL